MTHELPVHLGVASPRAIPTRSPTRSRDAVLDAMLADDPNGRVACETLVTTGLVVVAGEITTDSYVDIPQIVRETIAEIGYDGREVRLRRRHLRRDRRDRRAVARHRAGRRRRHRERAGHGRRRSLDQLGRRRPGDDVRLRLRRDRRADAAADLARAPARRAARRGPQGGRRSRTCGPTARRRSRSRYEDGTPVARRRRC